MSMITLAWGKWRRRKGAKDLHCRFHQWGSLLIHCSVSLSPLGHADLPTVTCQQRPVDSFRLTEILGTRHFFSSCMIIVVH